MTIDVEAAKRKPISQLTREERIAIIRAEDAAREAKSKRSGVGKGADGKVESWRDAPANAETAARIRQEVGGTAQIAPSIREVCLSDIQIKPVDWLWKRRIARGVLTLLEGIEGEGKSTVLCAIAAAVTCGQGLEDMVFDGPGNALWLSAEDSPEHVLKPRLLAAGAEQSRVFIVGEAFTFDDRGAELVREMAERRKPSLIVIDPIFAYAKGDPSKGADARAVTNKLKQIAEDFNCAIVLVRHVGKSKGLGDPRAAGLYSIEWRAAARSVLLCGSDPDNPQVRALTQSKNNLSPLAESIGYVIEEYPPGSEVTRAMWTGASQLTAKRILAQVADEDEKAERVSADDFLKDLLRGCELKATEIASDARRNGISERTLHRAKARLRIRSRSEGFNPKVWYWRLPDLDEPEDPKTDPAEDCQTADSGNLRVSVDSGEVLATETPKIATPQSMAAFEGCHTVESGNLREKFADNRNEDNGLLEGCHTVESGNLRGTPKSVKNGKTTGARRSTLSRQDAAALLRLGWKPAEIDQMAPETIHAILHSDKAAISRDVEAF